MLVKGADSNSQGASGFFIIVVGPCISITSVAFLSFSLVSLQQKYGTSDAELMQVQVKRVMSMWKTSLLE